MLSLILLASLGVSYDVMGPATVSYAGLNEQCYNLGCQCRDCSGAECRCGTLAKIPAAIPVIESPVQQVAYRQVRVCGPNGCSIQMAPTQANSPTILEGSNSSNSSNSSCESGQCGISESRGFRPFKVFRGGKGKRGGGCRSCGG